MLRLCAGLGSAENRAARACQLIESGIDWNLLILIATQTGMMPLLYTFVTAHCGSLVPHPVIEDLRVRYAMNALRNLALARELVRVCALFEENDIGVLALKGPILALHAYGDIAMRQFSDIDLLVRRPDVARAAALLAAENYQPRLDAPQALLSDFFQSSEDIFSGRDGVAYVDLHWRLTPRYFPFAPSLDSVWRRAVSVDLEGHHVRALGAADQLLFICVHASKHAWSSFDSVAEVAHLLKRQETSGEIQWPELLDQARADGSRRMLIVAIALARDILDAAVPPAIAAELAADRTSSALAVRLGNRLLGSAKAQSGGGWMVPLRTIDGRGRRIAYAADRALAPTVDDWEFIRLPRTLFPLYYLIRPLRLAFRCVAAVRPPARAEQG